MSNWKYNGEAPDHHGGRWVYYVVAGSAYGFQSNRVYKAEITYNKTLHLDHADQPIAADTHVTAHVQYTDKASALVAQYVVHYYPLAGNYTGQLAALPLELQQYVIDALQHMAQLP